MDLDIYDVLWFNTVIILFFMINFLHLWPVGNHFKSMLCPCDIIIEVLDNFAFWYDRCSTPISYLENHIVSINIDIVILKLFPIHQMSNYVGVPSNQDFHHQRNKYIRSSKLKYGNSRLELDIQYKLKLSLPLKNFFPITST